jgi:hypothetical protein
MTEHDTRHTTDADKQGDGSLGPGTTAGGGAVRAGERVDDPPTDERDAPRDRDADRD